MNVVFERFDTVNGLVNTLNARPNNKIFGSKKESVTSNENFTGTKTYEEASELLATGWDEPLGKIKKSLDKVNYMGSGSKPRPQNAIVGYVPNVPNALRGLPESMITIRRIPQKVRAITIYYSPDANCFVTKKTFIECGIKILSVINKLEAEGIRVTLYSTLYCATYGDEFAFCPVKLKDFRDKLDLKKICFPIAHASWLRRIGFKWIETCSGLTQSGWPSGYGRAVMDKDDKNKVEKILRTKKILKDTDYFFILDEVDDMEVDEILAQIKK